MPKVMMNVRDEHRDESLWRNSLKLHLTGRNAAIISCDAIRAALLAVGVNPKDTDDLWCGKISHQINLSFKTEGGVMSCLTANTHRPPKWSQPRNPRPHQPARFIQPLRAISKPAQALLRRETERKYGHQFRWKSAILPCPRLCRAGGHEWRCGMNTGTSPCGTTAWSCTSQAEMQPASPVTPSGPPCWLWGSTPRILLISGMVKSVTR